MKIGLQVPRFTWPGGAAGIASKLAGIAKAADRNGFSSLWVMDHFYQVGQADAAEGYRGVLASRSAQACLLGNMLAGGSWAGGVVAYSVTYLREAHILTLTDASRMFSGLVVGVLVGNYLGGLAASRLGVKRVIVTSTLLTGLLIVCYMNSPGLGPTVALTAAMSLSAGVVLTCANTLLLGQVPQYRGTVTSLNSAATQLGVALRAALGGVALSLIG